VCLQSHERCIRTIEQNRRMTQNILSG
jgi:hypothetical protein